RDCADKSGARPKAKISAQFFVFGFLLRACAWSQGIERGSRNALTYRAIFEDDSLMRIGLDVAQTCLERHGWGWIADSVATAIAISNICQGDEVILYHQFGDWLNWDTSRGTVIGQSHVSAPFLGSSWFGARIAWKRIEAGRSNLPGDPEVVHSFSFQAPNIGN